MRRVERKERRDFGERESASEENLNTNLRVLSLSKEKHVMEAEKATRTDDGETEMMVGGEAPMTKDDDGFGGGNGGVPSATTKTNGKVEEKKNSIHQIAPEEAPFAGGGGDAAAAAARVAAAMAPVTTTTTTTTAREQQQSQSQSQCLPIRILEDFDVREKADEKNLVALTSAMKPSDLVVFGKARKVEGGENELPSTLLMKKLQPQLRPPHPLKLVDVLDWCVSYVEVEGGGRILFGWSRRERGINSANRARSTPQRSHRRDGGQCLPACLRSASKKIGSVRLRRCWRR